MMRKHTISFTNAAKGIATAAKTQANIRIHLLAATIVFVLGVVLKISLVESLVLLLTVSIVIVAEMVNTAIEFMSDAITEEHNQFIGFAKDVAAGAVLVSAICASIIGLVIFVPKML